MEKYLKKYVHFVVNHPWKLLLTALIVTAGATAWVVLAKPLRLDTSFTTLLPEELPCVREATRTSELLGSTDYLTIAVESPNPEDNREFVEALLPEIQKLPEVTWAAVTEDKSFFRDRLLLYLDTEDLREIVARAKSRVDYEKKIANPFYIALDDEKAPDISFDDIMEKYPPAPGEAGRQGRDQRPGGRDRGGAGARGLRSRGLLRPT